MPQAHSHFLQNQNSPNIRCIYIKRILNELHRQKIRNLQKCKRLQKVFHAYYHAKKGSSKDFIPRNVYEGRWLCFFNRYVLTNNELILFNMALHIHAKKCVDSRLNRITFNEIN